MSPFIEKPWRDGGVHFTAEFTAEMLDHLFTCGQIDTAAGYDPRTVSSVIENLEALLHTAGDLPPRVFISRLSYEATTLPGGEVERWAKYVGGLLTPAIHPARERHLLPENWGLTARQLQEKLRSSR